jgi:hypothetical protein
VVVPETVLTELTQPRTPAQVRAWIENPPAWLEIAPDPLPDPSLGMLDPGERAAIGLAIALNAHRFVD